MGVTKRLFATDGRNAGWWGLSPDHVLGFCRAGNDLPPLAWGNRRESENGEVLNDRNGLAPECEISWASAVPTVDLPSRGSADVSV
jgi:hypothetical protein